MKIGLADVDSKNPNLALMKLSSYHKAQGDDVSFWSPIEHAMNPFDKIYASKVFFGTSDDLYLPEGTIRGGSGYNMAVTLPDNIEHICPDYDLYGIDYSMGFTSRGCIRRCGFCIVPEKEGGIKEHSPLSEFVRHKKAILLDNNFLASPRASEKLIEMRQMGVRVDFNQGLDIRLMTAEFARLLTDAKPLILRFAWDNIRDEAAVKRGISLLRDAGYKIKLGSKTISFYILTNYNSTIQEDLYRINYLHGEGIETFVMIYDKDSSTRLHREICSYANFPWAWKRMSLEKWLEVKNVPSEVWDQYEEVRG